MVKAFQSANLAPAVAVQGKSSPPRGAHVHAQAHQQGAAQRQSLDRRGLVLASLAGSVLASKGAQAAEGGAKEDFSLFKPSKSKTPALRAGTVDKENPYSFLIPKNWKEQRVANIQSGNYCQPRCAEPWTEVIFADDTEGKASVIVAPLVRLTNKKDAKIEDIGKPEDVLASIGPFITGSYLDAEDVQSIRSTDQDDGLRYYYYDAYATYGLNGPHTLTAATVKGDLVLLFSASANDKQYSKSKTKLDTMVQSFRA